MAQAVAIGTGNRLFIPTAQASPFADSRARTGQNPDPEMISAAAAASLLLLTGAHGPPCFKQRQLRLPAPQHPS